MSYDCGPGRWRYFVTKIGSDFQLTLVLGNIPICLSARITSADSLAFKR
jgi:hypothetical protein